MPSQWCVSGDPLALTWPDETQMEVEWGRSYSLKAISSKEEINCEAITTIDKF